MPAPSKHPGFARVGSCRNPLGPRATSLDLIQLKTRRCRSIILPPGRFAQLSVKASASRSTGARSKFNLRNPQTAAQRIFFRGPGKPPLKSLLRSTARRDLTASLRQRRILGVRGLILVAPCCPYGWTAVRIARIQVRALLSMSSLAAGQTAESGPPLPALAPAATACPPPGR